MIFSIVALSVSIAIGTLGFYFIEGWSFGDSLYMTLMTVTTVGYGSPHPLSVAGRNFAIVFMVVGVGAAGYALSSAVQALVQSEIVAAFGRRRQQREISKMRNHYIICGAGRIGSRIIKELQRAGVTFVVIERDPNRAAELNLPDSHILLRDATLDASLREAGIERAHALASCLPDDAENLYVVLTARDLNRDLHIVSRAVEETAEPKLIKAGASRVVSPNIIGSHRMATALMKPAVADFMDSIAAENLDLAFEQIEVSEGSKLSGRTLSSTQIRPELDIVIAAVRRSGGEMIFNPSGEIEIKAGDLLVAIGRAESLAELARVAQPAS